MLLVNIALLQAAAELSVPAACSGVCVAMKVRSGYAGTLQLVFKVNKMRGHFCIFQAAKLAVEQQSNRRFLVMPVPVCEQQIYIRPSVTE